MARRQKDVDQNPLGVPLGDLVALLEPTSIKATLEDNKLVARQGHDTTVVEVVPAESRVSEDGQGMRAVVRVTTRLPPIAKELFKEPEATVAWNAFAALGGLFWDRGHVYLGSRLTIYKSEDAWQALHLPLLLFTIILGTQPILGAMKRAITKEGPREKTRSKWTENDLEQVKMHISPMSLSTTGGRQLTAEFGLSEGAVSASAGDRTALFQEMVDQPHPEVGGGLLCLLQMPHQLKDESDLKRVCIQLNKIEMAALDLPPHFGAWCEGRNGNNLAYISFLPNALHSASGIAVNAAFWAKARAEWAEDILASLLVPPAPSTRLDTLNR